MSHTKTKSFTSNSNSERPNQSQGSPSWDAYDKFIKDADEKYLHQFLKVLFHIRLGFLTNIITYVLFFLVIALLQFYSIKIIFGNPSNLLLGTGVSLIDLLSLFVFLFLNPVKQLIQSFKDLAKIQIIFLGFIQQISQINAAYKQYLLSGSIKNKKLDKSLQSLQEAIESNIETLTLLDDE